MLIDASLSAVVRLLWIFDGLELAGAETFGAYRAVLMYDSCVQLFFQMAVSMLYNGRLRT